MISVSMSARGSYRPSHTYIDEICIPASFQLADGALPFAYGDVLRSSRALFNPRIEQFVNRVIDKCCSGELSTIIGNSKVVTCSSFPLLDERFDYCKKQICINEEVDLLICPSLKELNGLSFEYQGKSYIMIGYRVLSELNDNEILFLLGHELGHVVIGHLNYHMVCGLIKTKRMFSFPFGSMIIDEIMEEYNAWRRDSEYTADRAGLICCGSIDGVNSLIVKTVHTNHCELESIEDISSHPRLTNRLEQLKLFQLIIQNNHL